MNYKQGLAVMAVSIFGFNPILMAQSVYTINESKAIEMKLSGTSTLHNWEMEARSFDGEAQFGFAAENGSMLNSVKALTFSLKVQDLKSGENKLDKNAYKALKTDQFKDIYYHLSTATVQAETNGRYMIQTQGKLTIAGVTKEVVIDVNCAVNKDGTITCTGSHQLKMTDYQVTPPSFMLGAMTTGDAITLNFTLVYEKQPGI